MKYSKRVREEAALICAIAASTPKFEMVLAGVAIALGVASIGAHRPSSLSLELACKAWWHPSLRRSGWDHQRAAAAEQYLRTGWSP